MKVITQHFVGGECIPAYSREGRVEDGRGSLGHSATLRFPSPLIEPDVRISCKAGGPGRAKLYDEIEGGDCARSKQVAAPVSLFLITRNIWRRKARVMHSKTFLLLRLAL